MFASLVSFVSTNTRAVDSALSNAVMSSTADRPPICSSVMITFGLVRAASANPSSILLTVPITSIDGSATQRRLQTLAQQLVIVDQHYTQQSAVDYFTGPSLNKASRCHSSPRSGSR